MKESKLIWMQKEIQQMQKVLIQQMQKVLMIMIQRIEIIEKKLFEEEVKE
jgi:hypothetical protein